MRLESITRIRILILPLILLMLVMAFALAVSVAIPLGGGNSARQHARQNSGKQASTQLISHLFSLLKIEIAWAVSSSLTPRRRKRFAANRRYSCR
jgi:hypothetical protein